MQWRALLQCNITNLKSYNSLNIVTVVVVDLFITILLFNKSNKSLVLYCLAEI